MSIDKSDVINVMKNLEVAKAWANGTRIQFKSGPGQWDDVTGSVDFSEHPSRYRIRAEHSFDRWIATWTSVDGKIEERIHKTKEFGDEFVRKLRTYKGFRDAKLHHVVQELDV
jgi:hypothetical protein